MYDLNEMRTKYLNKNVSFQTASGAYIAGIVVDVDENEPEYIYIAEKSGYEHFVNTTKRDVVIQGE